MRWSRPLRAGFELLIAWVLLGNASLRLRFCGFQKARSWAEHASTRHKTPLDPIRADRAIRRAARCLPAVQCLQRSLALLYWLRTHGHLAQLRLGVAPGTPFRAHAWVELDRLALGETALGLRDFTPLDQANPSSPWPTRSTPS